MSEPFATSSDLEDRWPSFPSGQEDYADTLLADSSDMIRERWPNVDARVTAGTLSENTLTRIVCGMAKRAMLAGDNEGVESESTTTGPYSDTRKFANPNGNLYFSSADIATLDGLRSGRAFAVDLAQPIRPCY